jgi:SpoIID/LytB domain protein
MRGVSFPTAVVAILLIIATPALGHQPTGAPPPSPVPVGDPTTTVAPPPGVEPTTIPGSPVPSPPTAPPTTQPGIRTLVLNGKGWGHGRGLGQWGAYGYAVDKGWNYKKILQHFYGNTSAGKISPESAIAVRLISQDAKPLTVYQSAGQIWIGANGQVTGPRPGDGYGTAVPGATLPTTAPATPGSTAAPKPGPVPVVVVTAPTTLLENPAPTNPGAGDPGVDPNATTTTLPPPPAGWTTLPPGPAVVRVQSAGPGKFTISEATSCAGPFTVRATVSAPNVALSTGPTPPADREDPATMLQLCQSNGNRRVYRGELVAVDAKPQYNVNRVLMEDYLRGVLPAEVPIGWGAKPNGMEALKAQAVAARSYASAERRSGFANTCDTTACQVYVGKGEYRNGTYVSFEDPKPDEAVKQTASEVRVDAQGTPVRTEFSSSTGGQTAPGAFPPVVDEGDATKDNPNANWTVTLTAARLEAGRKLGAFRDIVVTLRDGVGPYGGRVQNLMLKFEKGDVALKSGEFLRAYNLRSVLFETIVLDSNTPAGQAAQAGGAAPATIPSDGTSGNGVGLANGPVTGASAPGEVPPTPPGPTTVPVPVSTKKKQSANGPKATKTTKAKSPKGPVTTVRTTAAGQAAAAPAAPAAAAPKSTKASAVAASKKPKTSVEAPTTTQAKPPPKKK